MRCNPDVWFDVALNGVLNYDGVQRNVTKGFGQYGRYSLRSTDF